MREAAPSEPYATALASAKRKYPDAKIKFKRGRLVIYRGDVIGLVPVRSKST